VQKALFSDSALWRAYTWTLRGGTSRWGVVQNSFQVSLVQNIKIGHDLQKLLQKVYCHLFLEHSVSRQCLTDWPRSGRLCESSSSESRSSLTTVLWDCDRGQQRDLTKADQRLMRSIASISLLGASSPPPPSPLPPLPPLFDDRLWAPNELRSRARNRFSTWTMPASATFTARAWRHNHTSSSTVHGITSSS